MDKDTEKYVCDFRGNPTKVGDHIVYVKKIGSASKLAMGTVSGISSAFGKECVVIGRVVPSRITSQNFYKVDD